MKKAIIVVSFGTSYQNAFKNSIEKIRSDIKKEFPEYDHFLSFTAHMIIKKMKDVYNIHIDTPEETLNNLYKLGYEEVIMQPLHIIPGEEFDYIKNVQENFKDKFKSLKVGRPILYYQGIEEVDFDYSLFIDSIKDILDSNKNVVFFGHGTSHPASSAYSCLQVVLEEEGYDNAFVGTVEGHPTLDSVIKRLKRRSIKEVLLLPLMVVCGDHVLNDMASDDEDSWKSILEAKGIKVNLFLKGLGEIEAFRNLYVKRVHQTINDTFKGIGETKKGKKNENFSLII
ncbi:MAG: sirohydrochlorin cobaltochelatase [Clostridium sp.]|uniref:sirohydrochlorin cobaltochelatase n=1 Tax=Clostridium sp. TaxID=1506 RepID=UPI003F300110